jgi:transcriptional regulator with XRE-family HTH domain
MGLPFARVTDESWRARWRDWVTVQFQRHGWSTQAECVAATGLDRTLVSNWLSDNPKRQQQPSMANCRKAAEAFGVSILEVFVAVGYLSEDEVGKPPRMSSDLLAEFEDMSAQQLSVVIQRAMVILHRKMADLGQLPERLDTNAHSDAEVYRAPTDFPSDPIEFPRGTRESGPDPEELGRALGSG